MKDVKELLEAHCETPEEDKPDTQVAFADFTGAYSPTWSTTIHSQPTESEPTVKQTTFVVRVRDCEGDLLHGIVTRVQTEHYKVTTLYLGAQITLLQDEGGAIAHPYYPGTFPNECPWCHSKEKTVRLDYTIQGKTGLCPFPWHNTV